MSGLFSTPLIALLGLLIWFGVAAGLDLADRLRNPESHGDEGPLEFLLNTVSMLLLAAFVLVVTISLFLLHARIIGWEALS